MNPPAFLWRRRVRFLDWNESGFETGPRAGVMLLKITLHLYIIKVPNNIILY
jgi:hypothetical protein